MRPDTPIFDLTDTFDTTVAIGDQQLPIHVKRFSRAEMEAFEKKWATLVATPRGTAEPDDAAIAERETKVLAFFDEGLREAITLDEGLVRDRGKWVTDGAGLIGVFHARKDVLANLLTAIYVQNKLSGVLAKNSNAPRASDGGSALSIPARGGDAQGPTAGSVASSTTASNAAATDEADPASSSGETTRLH